MRIRESLKTGLSLAISNPALALWIYLGLLLVALGPGARMLVTLDESFGSSLVREDLRTGFDLNWYEEFAFKHPGEAETFGPSTVGILPLLTNFEALIEGRLLQMRPEVLLAGILFLLMWAFLAGGILDRYCRSEAEKTRSRLFSQGARYFFRMVRLLLLSAVVYTAIFRIVRQPLLNWLTRVTRDVTTERTVILGHFAISVLVLVLLLLASLLLDYAKISLVCEERHSSVLAALRGLRFVAAHPGETLGLYGILLVPVLILFSLFALIAPGPTQATGFAVLMAFLVGQVYLIARILIKLWFLASQATLFQALTSPAGNALPIRSDLPPETSYDRGVPPETTVEENRASQRFRPGMSDEEEI